MYRVKTRVFSRDRAHHASAPISNLIGQPQDWPVVDLLGDPGVE